MRVLARKITDELYADLKAKKIEAINIENIRTYIKRDREVLKAGYDPEHFEQMVTRMVVEGV